MRFTSNPFIVSTVALLSLITPAVNAYVANITTPSSGGIFFAGQSVNVTWVINNRTGLEGVFTDIELGQHGSGVHGGFILADILQSHVPVLSGKSNGSVELRNLATGEGYFIQLLSHDGQTVYGRSGDFSIITLGPGPECIPNHNCA